MSNTKEWTFSHDDARSAEWTPGLREIFEYRDLGIKDGTKGDYVAHLIRRNDKKVKDDVQQWHVHDLHDRHRRTSDNALKAGAATTHSQQTALGVGAADHDRRGFGGTGQTVGPDLLHLRDVGSIDLGKRGKTGTGEIVIVGGPITALRP